MTEPKKDKEIQLDVFALPDLIPPDYAPDAAAVIDVLRATSTMTTALANGAKKIIPVSEPDETLRMKTTLSAEFAEKAGKILTGGERGGVRIDGFDLGNSPASYGPEQVADRLILFSTTNGTRALLSLTEPKTRKFLASFLNAEAVVRRLWEGDFNSIAIVCSGTDRQFTEEDLLLAGLLTDRLVRRAAEAGVSLTLNIQAETARYQWTEFWRSIPDGADSETIAHRLVAALKTSHGGRNLLRVGLTGDIPDVCRLDSLDLVPEFRLGGIEA